MMQLGANLFRVSLALSMGLGAFFVPIASAQARERPKPAAIVPDEVIQQHLDRIVRANAYDFLREVANLVQAIDESKRVEFTGDGFLRQVLYHAAHGAAGADGTAERRLSALSEMLGLRIMSRLNLWPGPRYVYVLVPYLKSDDPGLRDAAAALLVRTGAYETEWEYDDEEPRFDKLGSIPDMRGERLPAPVVLGMFRSHPDAALRVMTQLYVMPPVRERDPAHPNFSLPQPQDEQQRAAAEDILANIERIQDLRRPHDDDAMVAELMKLARSEHWFVRAYAAALVSRSSILRRPELLAVLQNDRDELVRQFVAGLKPILPEK